MQNISLICLLLFSLINHTYAQDMSAEWNMREKDRLIKSVEELESYQGVINPRYDFEIHQIFPAADTVSYLRITDYDSIICNYANVGAEAVVNAIFRDMLLAEAPACKVKMRMRSSIGMNQALIGQQEGELVMRVELGMDQFGIIHSEQNKLEALDENILPLAVIDDATLCLDLAKEELFMLRKGQRVPVVFDSGEILTNARALKQMVKSNRTEFFIPVNIEDEVGFAKLDPSSGNAEMFLKAGFITGFTDQNMYYISKEGFKQMNLKKRDKATLFPSLFMNRLELLPIFIPDQKDKRLYLNSGRGILLIFEKDIFLNMDIDFERYNELDQQMKAIRSSFEEEGLSFWDYYDQYKPSDENENNMSAEAIDEAEEVSEMEEAVEESAASEVIEESAAVSSEEEYQEPELISLNKQQEKQMKEYLELKEELDRIKSKFKEYGKNPEELIMNSEKIEVAIVPQGYQLNQHPVDGSILLVSEKPDFPVFGLEDLLIIDKQKLKR